MIQILLVIFSLEIDRVATILLASANGLGIAEFNPDTFEFLQIKAIISGAAISFFVFLSYYLRLKATENSNTTGVETRISIQSELVTTVVVMTIASSLVIFSDLVKIEPASPTQKWSVVLFVLLYVFVVISPLVHSEKYNNAEILIRYERMRVIFTTVIICFLVGLLIRVSLKKLGYLPVYKTDVLLALGFLWYALSLEPLRHRSEWPRILTSFLWVSTYLVIGFLSGVFYGARLYSGKYEYIDKPQESAALFTWGFYGLSPILAYIFCKLVLRRSDKSLWKYTYFITAVLFIALTYILHEYSNQEGGIIVGVITALTSILIIYIPQKFLVRSVSVSRPLIVEKPAEISASTSNSAIERTVDK